MFIPLSLSHVPLHLIFPTTMQTRPRGQCRVTCPVRGSSGPDEQAGSRAPPPGCAVFSKTIKYTHSDTYLQTRPNTSPSKPTHAHVCYIHIHTCVHMYIHMYPRIIHMHTHLLALRPGAAETLLIPLYHSGNS